MAVTIDKIISSITPPANKAVAWYNPLTGKLYINNGSWIGIKAEDEGGGGATGIRVGYINEHSTGFPTTRPDGSALVMEDYVSVSADATVPFTLGGITFNSKRDTGVWSGSQWVLAAGAIIESKEIISATSESLSGTATRQNTINEEVVSKVGQDTLDVDSKTNITLAVNYIWQELQKAGYTFNVTETDSDSVRSFKVTIKDYNNQVIYEKTLSDFILKTREIAGIDLTDNITDQELEEALKEIEVEYKNKTINADYNTIKNLETDNFNESALAKSTKAVVNYQNSVDTKFVTEKFLQKALQNIFTPENDADATNKKYVDDLVEGLAGKVMKFKGFISEEAPTGLIKDGTYWYADVILPDTFPINVKTYNATTGTWSSDTVEYTPNTLDLWSCLNDGRGYYWFGNDWNLIDENVFVDDVMIDKDNEGKLTFKEKTSTDEDKVWRVNNLGKWQLSNVKECKVVNTFEGEQGKENITYLLTNDVTISNTLYNKGIYNWTSSNGFQLKYNFFDWKVVNSFTGFTPSEDTLYILSQDIKTGLITTYLKGFYKWDSVNQFTCLFTYSKVDDEIIYRNESDELTLKPKTANDEGKSWRVNDDGEWELKEIKECKLVSTFAGEEGKEWITYFLVNEETIYPRGIYNYNSLDGFVLQQPFKDWLVVSTFEGQTPSEYTLYILTQNVTISGTEYKKGFYTWTELGGYQLRSGSSEVFIDCEELPSTNITDQSVYRLHSFIYKHDDTEIEEPTGYKFTNGSGYLCNSEGIYQEGAEGEEPTLLYTWDALTTAILESLFEEGLQFADYENAQFFSYYVLPSLDDLFDIASNFTREDKFQLYHNPTQTTDGYLGLGGEVKLDDITITKNIEGQLEIKDGGITNEKLDSDIKIGSLANIKTKEKYSVIGAINELGFVDVQTLPTSNISKYSIYRIIEYVYTHNSNEVEFVSGYSITDAEYVSVSSTGITIDGTETLWGNVTPAQITELETNEKIAVATYENSAFCSFRYDNTLYFDIKSAITKTPVYNLYHNPTETIDEYIKINGNGSGSSSEIKIDGTTITLNSSNELQATAIIDVETLPVSGIIVGVYYRRVETTPVRMVKLYEYDTIQGWINLSKIFISQTNYNLLSDGQKNDGTMYIVDGLSEVLVDFTYTTIANKPSINGITLLGNLSLLDLNLYSRTEVDQLLANKGSAEFVEYVPQPPVALTWYYSTHFVDQSLVPDGKRALYILDKNNVLQYMGVVGDVDLSVYYTKTEIDDLFALHYTKTESDEKFQEKLTDDTAYSTITDNDIVVNVDLSTKKVKKVDFSVIWTWIKGKITQVYYPVGTVIFNMGDNPSTNFGGTWELLTTGTKALYLDATAGTTIAEELPNIKGEFELYSGNSGVSSGSLSQGSGAFKKKQKSSSNSYTGFTTHSSTPGGYNFDASRSNAIYKDNGHVRPAGITICAWKRTV